MKIVIIGAGVGGICTYQKLRRILPDAEYVIIDNERSFLFTPRLTEIISGRTPEKYIVKLLKLFNRNNSRIEIGCVKKVDLKQQKVFVNNGNEITYDYLIFSQGAKTNYFGLKVSKHCFEYKNYQDAINLKKEISNLLTKEKGKISVIGGGPTGTELAFAIKDYLRKHDSKIEVEIFQAGKTLVPQLDKRIIDKAMKYAKKEEIKVHTRKKVLEITKNKIKLKNETIRSDIIIWAAGVTPNVIETNPKLKLKNRHIIVKKTLQLEQYQNVFSIGDCNLSYSPTGKPYPPLAQIAHRQGVLAAQNIARLVQGKKLKEFNYNIRGIMLDLSEGHAAAIAGPLFFNGRIAGIIRDWYYRLIFYELVR